MVYENRIYSRAEMRRLDICTDEYELMRDEGDAAGTLVLKAEARNGMVRLFFTLSDGRKVITPVFWWQRAKGFFDLTVGGKYRLRYEPGKNGMVVLASAEQDNAESKV